MFKLQQVPFQWPPLAGTDDVRDGSGIALVECTALCGNEERDERSWRQSIPKKLKILLMEEIRRSPPGIYKTL